MKKCSYCYELIPDESSICPVCHRTLPPPSPEEPITSDDIDDDIEFDEETTSIVPPQRALYYVAALGLISGAFLPWVTLVSPFGQLTISGIQGDGILTAIAGVIIGLLALAYKDSAKKIVPIITLLLSLALTLLAINKIFALLNTIEESTYPGSLGIGLIITAIASILAFFAAVHSLTNSP